MDTLTAFLSEQTIERIGWVLVHFLWQGIAVAALIWCVLKTLGKASSNTRYIAACIGLGLMVSAPVVTFMLLDSGVPVTAGPVVEQTAPVTIAPTTTTTRTIVVAPVEASPLPEASWVEILIVKLEAALPYCVIGWAVGVAILSVWYLGGWCQLQKLRRIGTKAVSRSVAAKTTELAHRSGIGYAVGVVESALVQVPTVIGWLKPMILLPATALTGLDEVQLTAMIAHELAHIKRCDYGVNIFQTVVEILGFYHPGVWWASRQIRIERENCCDDMAVSLVQNRKEYAAALFTMEAVRAKQRDLAVAANGGHLSSRISRLAGKPTQHPKSGWIPSLILLTVVTVLGCGVIVTEKSNVELDVLSITSDDFSRDFSQKVAQFDIDNADLNKITDTFGQPLRYIWGQERLDKNNLPSRYVVVYPDGFQILVSQGKVVEIRFEHEQPKDYLFLGKLRVGSSLDEVFEIIGHPSETVEGQEIGWVENVLYKDINGRKGHCYYHRPDKDVRIFFGDYKVAALYITRSDYDTGVGNKVLEKADIPVTSTINEKGHIVDKIDYPFVTDPEVIGGWKSVDFIEEIDEFDPTKKSWQGNLFLNHLVFEKGGSIAGGLLTWTKGLVFYDNDFVTASQYHIKEIDGSTYMFYQWKSGDYAIRHSKPSYYVLKKALVESLKNEPMLGEKAVIPPTSTINEQGRIVDKIDYPFVNDPQVLGTWESADYLDEIEDFKVDEKQWKGRGGELFLNDLIFEENGRLTCKNDKVPNGYSRTWTKGLIINTRAKTASKYHIKEIDGSDYMFFEWKSGDYTYRYRKPSYYVLKKTKLTSEEIATAPQILTTGYLVSVPADMPELKGLIPDGQSNSEMIPPEKLKEILEVIKSNPDARVISAPKILQNDSLVGEIGTKEEGSQDYYNLKIKNQIQSDGKTIRAEVDFRRSISLGQDSSVTNSVVSKLTLLSSHAFALGGYQTDEGIKELLLIQLTILENHSSGPNPQSSVIKQQPDPERQNSIPAALKFDAAPTMKELMMALNPESAQKIAKAKTFYDEAEKIFHANTTADSPDKKTKMTEALNLYKQAHGTAPSDSILAAWSMTMVGICHDHLDDKKAAIEAYQKSVEIYPNSPGTYFYLGDAYQRLDQKEQAIEAYKNCMVLCSNRGENTFPYSHARHALMKLGLKPWQIDAKQNKKRGIKQSEDRHQKEEGQIQSSASNPQFSGGIDITPADFKLRYDSKRKTYALVVSIENQGDVTIPKHRIRYYRGNHGVFDEGLDETSNQPSGWYEAGPIEPGKTWNERTRDFSIGDGDYTFTVVLDYDHAVTETNEDNNRATLDVTIQDGQPVSSGALFTNKFRTAPTHSHRSGTALANFKENRAWNGLFLTLR